MDRDIHGCGCYVFSLVNILNVLWKIDLLIKIQDD